MDADRDFWHQGYGAALMGCEWVEAVAGRFLTQGERLDLARGWKAGAAELSAREADLQRQEEFEAAVSMERAGPAWDEIPL